MSALAWHSEPHPWGTGRALHTAGTFTVESWLDEGAPGAELLRYDLYDGDDFISSHRSVSAAKRDAQRLHGVDPSPEMRANLRRMLGALA